MVMALCLPATLLNFAINGYHLSRPIVCLANTNLTNEHFLKTESDQVVVSTVLSDCVGFNHMIRLESSDVAQE